MLSMLLVNALLLPSFVSQRSKQVPKLLTSVYISSHSLYGTQVEHMRVQLIQQWPLKSRSPCNVQKRISRLSATRISLLPKRYCHMISRGQNTSFRCGKLEEGFALDLDYFRQLPPQSFWSTCLMIKETNLYCISVFIRHSFIPFPDQLGHNPPCPLLSPPGSVTWALREVFCGWSRLAKLPSPSGRDLCTGF